MIFRGITRNIFILGIVSFFTDLGSQMTFPLIPLFLVSVLGAGAYSVGIVEGAAETTASILKVFSGFLSDKIKKRKPFVLLGYSMSTLTKPLFAFAQSWTLVLSFRVIERIGKGIRTAPRDAIVAESCDKAIRGKAYGFHRAMDGLGSILGAVLAFLLLPVFGYRNVFLFAFLPGIISVFFILFVKETRQPGKLGVGKHEEVIGNRLSVIGEDCNGEMVNGRLSMVDGGKRMVNGQWSMVNGKSEIRNPKSEIEISIKLSLKELPLNLKLFIAASMVFTLGHFGYAFLLLKAKDIGLADTRAILLYILFYAVYTICTIPAGILSDKVGRKPVLIAGYSIFGLTCLGLTFSSNVVSIIIFFAIYGVFFAMVDGAQRAFVVDLAPAHLKATALGAFHTGVGLVALPGGCIAGLLWDKINPGATFLYGFIVTLLSLVLFLFVKIKDRH